MMRRWRGRVAGPATLGILLLILAPIAPMRGDGREEASLVVRGPDGIVITRVPLPDGEFTLRYLNSVYRSPAEERYVVGSDGRFRLAGLAADELAVLEEYYAIDEPAWRTTTGPRAWSGTPSRPVVLERLTVAATDLGRRTLLVDGRPPLELWPLVKDEEPSIHLEVAVP